MKILRTDPLRPDPQVVKTAAEVLRRGGIVAAPTETVYGLFADARSDAGCARVFKAKGRPPDNPLIVHVDSVEMATEVAEVPAELYEVLKRVWPGPLTLVLKSKGVVSRCVTAGLETVAVRAPAHPVPLAIIRELGAPIAGPSANKAGRPSPTAAEHVVEDLGGEVDVVVDGGPTFFGVESTIIDVTKRPPLLLRPGPFTVEELERFFGPIEVPPVARGLSEADVAVAPGMKYRHYAPDTPLVVVHFDLSAAAAALRSRGLRVAVLCAVGKCAEADAVLRLGDDIYEVAKNLYGALRELDRLSVDVGLVPAVEERGIGLAVMNRLRKAAGHREAFNLEDLLRYELG
ncbi:L-threonylcarbamoyladenylate synthase [Pyrobaculum neutrophilum]|uniref:Threonylcarbamoyl-AMP synthase n=1 Tax=Pyrobaculum neutrophilum (strain DSM 2338 / JCM 9278 / NBRC 100436 / V24Sta) TaxID=444157 RepID=B1YAW7_PYRNV|nr:L-threonylcarbamoyladenylate synthase [Pyrobaculum neutrophilum]ACB40667.1 Sua5/YciO/YrdC/YwlC family protein [Pyrobaculum neutrophilum V24Sta]